MRKPFMHARSDQRVRSGSKPFSSMYVNKASDEMEKLEMMVTQKPKIETKETNGKHAETTSIVPAIKTR